MTNEYRIQIEKELHGLKSTGPASIGPDTAYIPSENFYLLYLMICEREQRIIRTLRDSINKGYAETKNAIEQIESGEIWNQK